MDYRDLNIIGNYWIVNPILVETQQDPIETRDDGFAILSNRENVNHHLRRTKFCDIFIRNGRCNRTCCNFAHSISEFVHPDCAFGGNCKKQQRCQFRHPMEDVDQYKKRINFTIPPNIV